MSATDPQVRRTFDVVEQELGFGMVPNIFRSMAYNPPLLAANWSKFKATILVGDLPRTVKEMIGVVVSEVNKSEYARLVHLHSLSVQGVPELWLKQLTVQSGDETDLPDSLAAVLPFAQRAARDPLSIKDYSALTKAGFTNKEIFEVVASIDLFQSVNAYTDLACVPVDAL